MALVCPFCRGVIPLSQTSVGKEPDALKPVTATPLDLHTVEEPPHPAYTQEDEELYRDVLFELRQEDIIHDDAAPTPTNLVAAKVVYNHLLEQNGGFFDYLGALDNEQREKIRVMYRAAAEAGKQLK